MAVGYRAVLRLDEGENAMKIARGQLYSWLVSKKRDRRSTVAVADWAGMGRHRLGPDAVLDVIHGERQGEDRCRYYRFAESNDRGEWFVSLYALDDGPSAGGVIVIEAGLEGVDEAAAMAKVTPPRLVRSLLDTVPLRDGRTPVHGTPRIAAERDVEAVLHAIADPERVAAVVVAASPGIDFEGRWREVVQSLTRESAGVATAFVVSWNAVGPLNERLPHAFRIEPGRIRTFLPGVDLDSPASAKRHPVLGPITLTRSLDGVKVSERLAKTHAASVRRRLLAFGFPPSVRRSVDLLHRIEAQVQREREVEHRAAAEPERPPETEEANGFAIAAEAIAGMAKRWLGVDDWTVDDLARLDDLLRTRTLQAQVASESLERSERRVQGLRADLEAQKERYDDLEGDLADLDEQSHKFEREAVELRGRLLKAGLYEQVHVPAEVLTDWSAPGSVEELVNRITPGEDAHSVLRWVEFTGDRDKALEIDDRDQLGRVASRLWDYVRVLADYAKARGAGYSGNVKTYLESDGVDGFRCSVDRHAENESDTVRSNPKWSAERMLPVPAEVDPGGTVPMNAHFKVAYLGQFSPRMHYWNDTARTGRVYIGYIGRHLTNTKT